MFKLGPKTRLHSGVLYIFINIFWCALDPIISLQYHNLFSSPKTKFCRALLLILDYDCQFRYSLLFNTPSFHFSGRTNSRWTPLIENLIQPSSSPGEPFQHRTTSTPFVYISKVSEMTKLPFHVTN